tara:strand:+ start:5712 stop:6497 length:786 start_codon:yes stop_codon:yes gene_type:complete
MKICFLGCGNIAQAIIDGLLKSGISSADIACIERNQQRIEALTKQNLQIIELENLATMNFDLIVLAVKPKDALSAEQKIFKMAPRTAILTVVAGLNIEKYSQPNEIIRAMPNTACAFGKGVTAIYAANQDSVGFNAAKKLFNKVGHVVTLQDEGEMHRFTSIIGSGQAFLFQVLNTYLQELEKITTSDQAATKSMFLDFITSLGDSFSQEENFERLINKIKSPGGTTQAGLESLKMNNLDKILQDAFQAAEDRSIEISNEQ